MMRRFLLLLALVMGILSSVHAQTLAEARALPAGSAVNVGDVTVLNVVDTISSTANSSFQVADGTAAATVFGPTAAIAALLEGVQPGDTLTGLSGATDSFNGLFQVRSLGGVTLSITGTIAGDGPPVPVEVTIADFQNGSPGAEANESRLVVLRGVAFTGAGQNFGSGVANYPVEAGGQSAVVRVATSAIAGLFSGQPIPTGRVDVVGVLSQFDSSSGIPSPDRSGGYQLLLVSADAITPSTFQDGAGGAILRNATALSPYAQVGRATPIFEPGLAQDVEITFTGVDLGALEVFEVTVPASWGSLSGANVVLDGAGFASANGQIDGHTLRITGAAVTDSATGRLLVTGLTPPAGEALVTAGIYDFAVRSAVAGSNTPAPIAATPRAWVTVPIERLRAVNDQGVPLLLNEIVAVAGVLTMEPFRLTDARTEAYLQDATAGVNLFSFRTDFDVFFEVGAPLAVRGRIIQFNGLTEIEPIGLPDIVELAGFRELPAPVPVEVDVVTLIAQGEALEGSLVRVPNLFLVSGTWPSSPALTTLVVSDGTAEIELVVNSSNFEMFEFTPAFPATITGIVSQRVLNPPFLGGYRLLPRTVDDFEAGEVTIPPTAVDDAFAAVAGVTAVLDVLANDSIPAGGPVTLEVASDPRLAVVDGKIEFLSDEGGEVVFSYTVFDGNGRSDTAEVTVTVREVPAVAPLINEFLANPPGVDTQEYIEIIGAPHADYGAYAILVIEGDGALAGTVDRVYPVGVTDANGLWVTPFLSNELENGTQTLLLVLALEGEPASLINRQLDTLVYAEVADGIAVHDGGANDVTYALTLYTDFGGGGGVVAGASRRPGITWTGELSDWVRNDPAGAGLPGETTEFRVAPRGLAYNTPGLPNRIEPDKPELVPYATFQSDERFFNATEAGDDAISGPLADPDGDGIVNLLEFVLGTSPRDAAGTPYTFEQSDEGWRLSFSWLAPADVVLWVEARVQLGSGESSWEGVLSFHDSDVNFHAGIPVESVVTTSVSDPSEPVPTEVNFAADAFGDTGFVRLRAQLPIVE